MSKAIVYTAAIFAGAAAFWMGLNANPARADSEEPNAFSCTDGSHHFLVRKDRVLVIIANAQPDENVDGNVTGAPVALFFIDTNKHIHIVPPNSGVSCTEVNLKDV
jgi:hypothetical protein